MGEDLEAQPVRFRVVLELTFPEADSWDPSDYGSFLDGMKVALEKANCQDVQVREALTIGPQDDYDSWRGGWKYDFSTLSPNTGNLLGVSYPVAAVDPEGLARVWDLMARAEAGELQHVNFAVAIGQTLGPAADAAAVLGRVSILRALQARGLVPAGASPAIFEKAANFPLESSPENDAEVGALARFFGDAIR